MNKTPECFQHSTRVRYESLEFIFLFFPLFGFSPATHETRFRRQKTLFFDCIVFFKFHRAAAPDSPAGGTGYSMAARRRRAV